MYGSDVNANQIAGTASNIRSGDNPSYTVADFLSFYPQFGTRAEAPVVDNVPQAVITLYIDLADATIKQSRFRAAWLIAMGYFIAHFCTLWMKTAASVDDSKDAIIAAGQSQGIVVSESVDGVSYSMDINSISQDLNGFADWKSTQFGISLATLAKQYGKGGMGIL